MKSAYIGFAAVVTLALSGPAFGQNEEEPDGFQQNEMPGSEFQLDIEAFHALHIRESAYDLLPAWTLAWEQDHLEPHISYFLSCRRETFAGRQTIASDILPHPKYHEVCEDGCRAVSSEFLDAFRASTWVRNTRMIDAGYDEPPDDSDRSTSVVDL